MCVDEAQTCIFNVFVSNAKLFISSMKHVRLQHQKYSSPAQNVFVASNKPVCRQCDPYFKVSGREYLVTIDEHVRLQCELMFGSELLD